MIDKKYCMSSYMAFRYIEDDNKDFYYITGGVNTAILKLFLILREFWLKQRMT